LQIATRRWRIATPKSAGAISNSLNCAAAGPARWRRVEPDSTVLRADGGLAARLGQLELDAAAIGRNRDPLDQAGVLEAVDERRQRGPAHADRGRQLARALRTFGRGDEKPVLGQADSSLLAGLLGNTRQSREEPNTRPEIDTESGIGIAGEGKTRDRRAHNYTSRSVGTVRIIVSTVAL
jgi:hypothetical protein